MILSHQIAKHFNEVYFGGNWTCSNFKDMLSDLSWQEATTQVKSFNTIATLVFHTNYFVKTLIKVLESGPLEGNDKFSFDHPPIHSEEDWNNFLKGVWADAESFTELIHQMPEEQS